MYGSVMGGCCYLFFIVFAAVFLTLSFKSFVFGNDFTIVNIEKSLHPSKVLNLHENKFTFAFRVTYDNGTDVSDNHSDLFNIETNAVHKQYDKKHKYPIQSRTCSSNDFYDLQNHTIFKKVKIDSFYCFDDPINLMLNGSYNDPEMRYIEYKVSLNQKYMDDYDTTQTIFKKNQFKLTMYYTNPLYDLTDRENPIFNELSSFYTYLDLAQFKRENVNFQEFVFADDKNLLIQNYQKQSYMKLNSQEEVTVSMPDRKNSELSDKKNLAKIFLRAINFQKKIKRQYTKIPVFLAGIINLLFTILAILGIFAYMLNNIKAKQSIIRQIAKYEDHYHDDYQGAVKNIVKANPEYKNNQGQKTDGKDGNINVNNNNDQNDDKDLIKVNSGEENEKLVKKDDTNKKEDEKLKTKPNQYKFGCCDVVRKIFGCAPKEKDQIYNNADSKIYYNTDIVTYLKKMHEIDVIKYMLLDEDSLKLMNFVSKPNLTYRDESGYGADEGEKRKIKDPFFHNTLSDVDYSFKMQKNDELGYLDELRQSYVKLLSKTSTNPSEKRIIELFEKQCKNIIKKD